MQTIALSFFHRKIGPIVVFNHPDTLDEVSKLRIADIMDQAFEEGFFTHSFGDLTSMNYYFEIFSSWARGNKEMVMVSIVLDSEVPSDLEHILLSWTIDFAAKLKNNMEIFKGFYLSDEENFSEEERGRIRIMHNQLVLWVKELYSATLEETREKTAEERIASLLKEKDVYFTIQKLSEGIFLLNDIKEWYNAEFPGKDFSKFLERVDAEKFVFVNEIGQDTYVLLVKQPNILRVPPDCVITLFEDKPEYEGLLEVYIKEVQQYFNSYTATTEDSMKLLDIIADSKMYNLLMQLREGPLQRDKLAEVVPESSLKSILDILKIMEDYKLIEEFSFNGENYLILLSDVQFKTAFPEYLAQLLQKKKEDQILPEIKAAQKPIKKAPRTSSGKKKPRDDDESKSSGEDFI